jgi:sugar phosphate isomerase/epimerase
MDIILAAKTAPEERILSDIQKAGISSVELFLSKKILDDVNGVIALCRKFPFKYVAHAPNDTLAVAPLKKLVKALDIRIVVSHDIFWEDEWKKIAAAFKGSKAKICIENIVSAVEPFRFIRRYGFGSCLDIEHLQFEIDGVFEEDFIGAIKLASHIHLTGYSSGSELWHTHIHHSPEHGRRMLDLIKKSGYKGMVVSEAKPSQQTYEEFSTLKSFFDSWAKGQRP